MTFTARHCTVAGTMAGEYAFTMKDLRKVVPPKREILRGIYLSFFHGAKIGVLGANGAGKSSLLRIMAGVDDDFLGEAFPGRRAAHRLPPAGAGARRRQGRAGQRRGGRGRDARPAHALRGGERQARRAARRRRDGEAPRGAVAPARSDRRGQRLGPRPHGRAGDGRAAGAAGRRRRGQDLRRRAAPRGAVPAAAAEARHAAAGRAHQPSRRRVGGVAGALPEGVHGHRGGRSPTIATSSTTPPAGSSSSTAATASRGRATTPPGSTRSRQRLAHEEKADLARQRTLERELEWVRLSPRARQAKSKARLQAYEQMLDAAVRRARREAGDRHPARAAPGRPRGRGRHARQGLRRPRADRRTCRSSFRAAASWA